MEAFIWALPEEGKARQGINVSSYGGGDYKKLSPFSHNKRYRIPVPDQGDLVAHSVEGIWQGLKVIHGQTDFGLFTGKPRKRRGQPEGHLLGNELLEYSEARKQIYVPTYIYHVINNALDDVKDDLEHKLNSASVILFDVESNNNIDDLSQPYSHAALLVDLLNVLYKAPLPPFSKERFTYLDDQLNATLQYRENLSSKEKWLLDEIITFAYLFSPNELRETFALRAIESSKVKENGRLRQYIPTKNTQEIYLSLCR